MRDLYKTITDQIIAEWSFKMIRGRSSPLLRRRKPRLISCGN
jgi:hypothetical protein